MSLDTHSSFFCPRISVSKEFYTNISWVDIWYQYFAIKSIDPFKIKYPKYFMHMKWTDYWWPACAWCSRTVKNIFEIFLMKIWSPFNTRYRKIYEIRKNAWVLDPFLLIGYTLGITKIPKWKYSMFCPGRKFCFF